MKAEPPPRSDCFRAGLAGVGAGIRPKPGPPAARRPRPGVRFGPAGKLETSTRSDWLLSIVRLTRRASAEGDDSAARRSQSPNATSRAVRASSTASRGRPVPARKPRTSCSCSKESKAASARASDAMSSRALARSSIWREVCETIPSRALLASS